MNSATTRDGEQENTENRSHRYQQKGEHWYIQTREGYELGPFNNTKDAEKGLNDYISFLQTADSQSIAQLFKKFNEQQQS